MTPGGVGYSDAPTFAGFTSKSPCSEHAMELGDMEAAFIGNLARYCMKMGTIPPFSLRGLWWVKGECKGLGVTGWDTDVEPIIPLIRHLEEYAPFIIGTHGVEDLLQAGAETRWYSEKMFPNESNEWVTEADAMKLVDVTVRTLQRWRCADSVRFLKDSDSILYKREDLELMKEIKQGNMKRGFRLSN